MQTPGSIPSSFKAPPKREPFTKAYWDGLSAGHIMLQVCGDCGKITHPPGPLCVHCLSDKTSFRPASGLGTVYAFTVSYRPLHEEFRKDVPYTVALVDLDEGPRIMTWLVNCGKDEPRIGMRVRAQFEQVTENTALHRFAPER